LNNLFIFVKLRQRQSRIDQLTYQSNADDRRHQTELNSMKQKMNDIEVLLLETRREADEYQKSIIERNADVAELERKVCSTFQTHNFTSI
jgi:hypothetical protein